MNILAEADSGAAEVVAAVLGATITGLITWAVTRKTATAQLHRENESLADSLRKKRAALTEKTKALGAATKEADDLRAVAKKYAAVRKALSASSVVRDYHQPVLVLGPRHVGKTSLVTQWHAPWDHTAFGSTQKHRFCTIPVYDFSRPDALPHFADSEVMTTEHLHLKLRVHDFPGELDAQKSAVVTARTETDQLRRETKKDLGIVLICMFDAGEAVSGANSQTTSYYNGELFANLKTMMGSGQIRIERLIIVFNKYDILAAKLPGRTTRELLKLCIDRFAPILEPLSGACNQERICETFTNLDRDKPLDNQGGSIVLGEAARGLVEKMAGRDEAERVIGEDLTTTFISPHL
ncbi:GTPase domain-containing protein [Saccharothrix violaceirubra]|uniref:Uncharacterized protein n=1 Tax=Saccharothrix violaceirubra TaxID=413306 RepID=A0A7W7WZS9_9PSEU|nr:GTPase domain-containing protein [Saccharothrix violaceirubra]MBB4969168.1 hypothetical protein [Saccharothrix violaceirubra]